MATAADVWSNSSDSESDEEEEAEQWAWRLEDCQHWTLSNWC